MPKTKDQTNPNKTIFTAKLVDLTTVTISLPLDTPKNNAMIKDKAIDVIEFFMDLNKENKEKSVKVYSDIRSQYPNVEKIIDNVIEGRGEEERTRLFEALNAEEQLKATELMNILTTNIIQTSEYKRAYKFIVDTFFLPYKKEQPKPMVDGETMEIYNLDNFDRFFSEILNYKEIVNIYVQTYKPFVDFLG